MTIPTEIIFVPAVADGLRGDLPVAVSVLCGTCSHLGPGLSCRAFPDGIPGPILEGRADHREPYPGDHGVRYELAEGVNAPSLG